MLCQLFTLSNHSISHTGWLRLSQGSKVPFWSVIIITIIGERFFFFCLLYIFSNNNDSIKLYVTSFQFRIFLHLTVLKTWSKNWEFLTRYTLYVVPTYHTLQSFHFSHYDDKDFIRAQKNPILECHHQHHHRRA